MEVWFETHEKYDSESMDAFNELGLLYESGHKPGPSKSDNEAVDDGEYVQNVKSWALPESNNARLSSSAHANLAHAYMWYGSRTPRTLNDSYPATQHYRAALGHQSKDTLTAIFRALSRAEMEVFGSTRAIEQLDNTVSYGQQAVDLIPTEDPIRAYYIPDLCDLLLTRSYLKDSPEDLDYCIDLAKSALVGDTDTAGIRSMLCKTIVDSLIVSSRTSGCRRNLGRNSSIFSTITVHDAIHFAGFSNLVELQKA